MNHWKRTAAALAGVALLGMTGLPALAAEPAADGTAATPEDQQIAPYAIGGQATIKSLPGQDNENQLLVSVKNPGEEAWDLALNLSDETVFLDNTAGIPVSLQDLKEGQEVYVYYSAAMTRSLPPQSAAYAVLTNVGEGTPAKFHVVEQTLAGPDGQITVTTDHGSMMVSATEETKISSLKDKSIVTAQDLKMGTRFFAWYDVVALSYPGQAAAERIVLLPQQDQQEIEIRANGKTLEVKAQMKDGVWMAPVRQVAEALGFTVGWDSQKRETLLTSAQGSVALSIGQDSYLLEAAAEDGIAVCTAPQSFGAAPEIQDPGVTWAPVQVFELLARKEAISFVDGALQIVVTAE